jgi:hypothetical protein
MISQPRAIRVGHSSSFGACQIFHWIAASHRVTGCWKVYNPLSMHCIGMKHLSRTLIRGSNEDAVPQMATAWIVERNLAALCFNPQHFFEHVLKKSWTIVVDPCDANQIKRNQNKTRGSASTLGSQIARPSTDNKASLGRTQGFLS